MPDSAIDLLRTTFDQGRCIRLVISQPRRGSRPDFSKVVVRPVMIGGRGLWQFTYHFPTRVTHENHSNGAAFRAAADLLANSFAQAALYTAEADYALRALPDGNLRVSSSPPTKKPAPATHDREKGYLIPEGVPCPFLVEIGVMTSQGQVRRAHYHKFRQINRYLELVQDIVPALPDDGPLSIVDFGCGKSYLTFALHHLLTAIHSRDVRIVGLDRQPDVIRLCSGLATKLGCTGLEFRQGDITEFAAEAPVDLAVSLHACDTATDAALAQAVRWNCSAILAVPCCQHELAPQIRIEGFAPLSRHGLLHERFAALATDALRASLLEIHGYSTQVVEFIDMEHTPKNVLIRGVRRQSPNDDHHAKRVEEYRRLLTDLGLETCTLERLLPVE